MKFFAKFAFFIIILILTQSIFAQESKRPCLQIPSNWNGLYFGITGGGAWGFYHTASSTVADGYINASQASSINQAGTFNLNAAGFATGLEAGYNFRWQNFLIGLETDLNPLNLFGNANSVVNSSNRQFVLSADAFNNWLFTARPRIGFVANDWLFYATGGLALTYFNNQFLFTDNNNPAALESASIASSKAGYSLGIGIEKLLTRHLSIKAEYLYNKFGYLNASSTGNNLVPANPNQRFDHSSDFTANIARVGLNYRFDDFFTREDCYSNTFAPAFDCHDWEIEGGVRIWYSTGTVGTPQPLFNSFNNSPTILVSRLTFVDQTAYSGETFARVDHHSGWFAKGYLGAGGITSGNIHDEDFPAVSVYSNTVSKNSGQLAYGTLDLGYTVLKSKDAKIGPFLGYNYLGQKINSFGCVQLAGDILVCRPGTFPSNFIGVTQYDHFNSVRVGLATEYLLTNYLKLKTEAAYIPFVAFNGEDDHNRRQLILTQQSYAGNGMMLEAALDYKVTPAWNVGLGGRYWTWNMRTGSTFFNFLGSEPASEPARYTTERYGVFLETSYDWDETCKQPIIVCSDPIDWTGIYLGGQFGGGWSTDNWSDPFGSTRSGGFLNVAGFGDTIRATGPFGGGRIDANWQSGSLVLGMGADANVANFRGDNTVFSGLGGLNGQHLITSLGTFTGKVGYAWDHSMLYAKAGGAWTRSTYNLIGNTNALTLGNGSNNLTQWGWVAGSGIEYAVNRCWSTFFEYNYINVPSTTVSFSTVNIINSQSIKIGQSINLINLGLNYKLA